MRGLKMDKRLQIIGSIVVICAILGSAVFVDQLFLKPSNQQCAINSGGCLGLTIINSSTGKAISELPVNVSVYVPEMRDCASDPNINYGSMNTDSNGTLMVKGIGMFHFSLKYNGSEYSAFGQPGLGGTNCLTLFIPSGRVVNSSSTYSVPYC